MSTAYEITADQQNIVIRVPKSNTNPKALSKLLDYLELESIQRRSQLDSLSSEELITHVKKGAWQQVEHLFEEA